MNQSLRSLACLLLLLVTACAINPQPTPPNLDPALVSLDHGEAERFFPGARIVGAPGSVLVPNGVIAAIPLDSDAPTAIEPINPDGSFDVSAAAGPGEEVRLETRNGNERSEPVDLVIGAGGLTAASRPFADCLVLRLIEETDILGVGGRLHFELGNACQETMTLSASLRTDPAGWDLREVPASLESGETIEIEVGLDSTPAQVEQTLILDVESEDGTSDRRAGTFFAAGM